MFPPAMYKVGISEEVAFHTRKRDGAFKMAAQNNAKTCAFAVKHFPVKCKSNI